MKKTKSITIRVSQNTVDRYERLRLAGANKGYPENSTFARIIFNVGLNECEANILPIEAMEEYPKQYPAESGARIIHFPCGGAV